MSLRVLITGANGQVGWQLQRAFAPLGVVTACTHSELDLSQPEAAARAVREIKPDILLNAAAYSNVDDAEHEPELARTVNGVAPGLLAREVARSGGLMVHYSTDYVFDGRKADAYSEEDPTGPLNVYGRTKLEGEQTVAASGCAHIILRTSWVYDVRGKNFLRRILRVAREREELRVVDDQHGAPTWARTLAAATAAMVCKGLGNASPGSWPHSGLYHLTAAGQTTWAGFARVILDEYEGLLSWPADSSEFGAPLIAKRIVPITSDQYKTPAVRPHNSVLSNVKLQAEFGIALPDWRHLLRLAMLDTTR